MQLKEIEPDGEEREWDEEHLDHTIKATDPSNRAIFVSNGLFFMQATYCGRGSPLRSILLLS